MRRTYKKVKSKKRKALEEKIFQQMRETRSSLDPDVLKMVQHAVQGQNADFESILRDIQVQENDYELVDKRKTYSTVLKFIGMRNFSREFMREVQSLLAQGKPH